MSSKYFATFFGALSIIIAGIWVTPSPVYAVDVLQGPCEKAPDSPTCQDANVGDNNPLFGEKGVVTTAFNLLSLIAGIAAVIVIILSGLRFVTSGSNPQDVNRAREGVIYAIAGVIVALIAQVIVKLFLSNL